VNCALTTEILFTVLFLSSERLLNDWQRNYVLASEEKDSLKQKFGMILTFFHLIFSHFFILQLF
jgi:hypothetical protein